MSRGIKHTNSFGSDPSEEREAENIIRNVIDICPFGVVLVDQSGVILLANCEIEQMFGYQHNELIGQCVDILVPVDQRAEHALRREEFGAGPAMRAAKGRGLSAQRKDGVRFPVEVGLNPIVTQGRAAVLGVVVDIGDQVRAERLKTEFVATVSHELRTPLTSIAGALGLLISNAGETLPKSTVRLLAIAHANSQRLVRLVNSILTMEKIESGKVMFVLKRVKVSELLLQAFEANQAFAEACGVRLTLNTVSTAEEIRGDPEWLMRAVANLLSNAIKFSPPDGEVVVYAERHGGEVRISIRDHGRGVPEDFKPLMFEKFAQADASNAREQGGAGLGLFVVKQIVTRLGGKAGFGDAPGGGAIFYIELPVWERGTAAARKHGVRPNASPQSEAEATP